MVIWGRFWVRGQGKMRGGTIGKGEHEIGKKIKNGILQRKGVCNGV